MGQQGSKARSPRKVLLLGIPGSGKTTLLMQVREILGVPLDEQEKRGLRRRMRSSALRDFQSAVRAVDLDLVRLQDPALLKYYRIVADADPGEDQMDAIPDIMQEALRVLWTSRHLQRTLLGQPDTLTQALGHSQAADIFGTQYEPSIQDAMRVRLPSSSLMELSVERSPMLKEPLRLVEVPGSRFARRQWIHRVERFPLILFLAPADLPEDSKEFIESLNYFDTVSNSRLFQDAQLFLVLTRIDILIRRTEAAAECAPGGFSREIDRVENRYLGCTERDVKIYHLCTLNDSLVTVFLGKIVAE